MSVERISSIRRSNLSTWPSLSGRVGGRQCGKGESWASLFVIIRWALSPGASSAQYLVRQEECLRVEWHLSLSLCPSTPSLIWAMKFPQKYMITQELSHLLSLIWPIFLSRLFSYISACIVSLVISFSLYACCRISVLLQNLWCPETLRTSYIMCETDFFWSRRKTNRSDNDCLRDISGAGRISTGRLNKPVCLSVCLSIFHVPLYFHENYGNHDTCSDIMLLVLFLGWQ